MTRSSSIKWIVGSVVFFLPTILALIGHSSLRWDVAGAFRGSLVLAAIVPPALVLSSRVKWRIALAFGLWVLLAVQFLVIVLLLLAGFRG